MMKLWEKVHNNQMVMEANAQDARDQHALLDAAMKTEATKTEALQKQNMRKESSIHVTKRAVRQSIQTVSQKKEMTASAVRVETNDESMRSLEEPL